ncbi:hypothetical protein FQN57_004987 [Myotisia sp. PD_48]|nr:hypothetical protein FQN57_004987 [Myotisia sp. PD_48]
MSVNNHKVALSRWYMDTERLTATRTDLPLVDTLQWSDQKTVKSFYHLSDRHMSLASYLLKYLFIHRACHVPWNQIKISRTPDPHRRPCYIPLDSSRGGNQGNSDAPATPKIEFNVSHQASLVALAGCTIPPSLDNSHDDANHHQQRDPASAAAVPQIGIDITCTDERERRNPNSILSTEEELLSFIDIFTTAFSPREIAIMKAYPVEDATSGYREDATDTAADRLKKSIDYRIRRFYTYWALKEAYIKMVGEGLLADWLQELEFFNVVPPAPVSGAEEWGNPKTDVTVRLYGRIVEDVRVEVVAFGERYILATASRGDGFGKPDPSNAKPMAEWCDFRCMDIERDIQMCARGECECLDQ